MYVVAWQFLEIVCFSDMVLFIIHMLSNPSSECKSFGSGIRKYGSTFYVWIGQVKNGHLYLRFGSSSEKTTANGAKTLTDKKPLLYYS